MNDKKKYELLETIASFSQAISCATWSTGIEKDVADHLWGTYDYQLNEETILCPGFELQDAKRYLDEIKAIAEDLQEYPWLNESDSTQKEIESFIPLSDVVSNLIKRDIMEPITLELEKNIHLASEGIGKPVTTIINRTIKHLSALISKYQIEVDLLKEMRKKPTNELHQAEISLNIDYFEEEIREIKEIIEVMEREEEKYTVIPMGDLSKVKSIRINPLKDLSEKEKLIISSIENVGFSSNTILKLKVCEIFTVLELISMSKENLKLYRNIGKNSMKEIEEFITNNGLSWNFKGL